MSRFFDENAFPEIDTKPPVTLTASPPFGEEAQLDFRLLFANRIVEQSWKNQKVRWSREDIGLLLMEILEDEYDFDWTDPGSVEQFKLLLATAYVAAGDVLMPDQRSF